MRRRTHGPVLALFAGGCAWFALVAVMTEAGYAGNNRYLIVSSAAFTILAGVGAAFALQGAGDAGRARERAHLGAPGRGRRGLRRRPGAGRARRPARRSTASSKMRRQLSYETSLWPNLEKVIEAGGGKERLMACGGLYSGPYQTQMVAYELGVHGADVRSLEGTPPPGAAFRTRTVPTGPLVIKLTDRRYRQIARVGKWRIVTVPPTGSSDCPAASRDTPRAPAGGRVSAG